MKQRFRWQIKYRCMDTVELNRDDSIKVVSVTDDGDILLKVNGKLITLVEQERLIDINI